jgi:hypothetical protein
LRAYGALFFLKIFFTGAFDHAPQIFYGCFGTLVLAQLHPFPDFHCVTLKWPTVDITLLETQKVENNPLPESNNIKDSHLKSGDWCDEGSYGLSVPVGVPAGVVEPE